MTFKMEAIKNHNIKINNLQGIGFAEKGKYHNFAHDFALVLNCFFSYFNKNKLRPQRRPPTS